ncbi:hypothetical protein OHA21_06590 [Actinoplanes sp. NBC_00393]|uniref:hypothetical protein n=1 Tax=Actinoplanes sp. NBC_00393 TaxID=2975953 RepID=UPI002E1A4653
MDDDKPEEPGADVVPVDESPASGADEQTPAEPAPEPPTVPEATPTPVGSPVEEGDAAAIDPDSLLIDRHVASEIFGDLYTGTTTHGPAQLGNNNTMHNYFGKQPLDPIISKLPALSVYVATDVDDQLDDMLSRRSTACLVGPRNSGRYSTARAALGRRHKRGPVFEIALPTDVTPEALLAKPSRLAEDSGFLLRLPGDGHIDVMRKLAALFRQRSSSLLLIKDEEPRRSDLHGGEVRHHAPEPIEVFRSHLTNALPDVEAEVIDGYLTDEVEAALKAVYGPKESVALANAIAREHPASSERLSAILNRSQPKRRERAAAILLPGTSESSAKGRRAGQHERAFRLSYAVFYRRPLHYVFEAADLLLREIDSAALRPDWGSMALQHPVPELLGPVLKKDWEAGREAGNAALGGSRIAWIRDAGLRGAIIDVAWHDFDGTRRSLLKWLDRLVSEGDETMRRAAAETAGLLVHYDFERVHEDLVDRWAASPKPDVRQAAAWTMRLSDMAGDVGPKVRAKLSEWCSSRSNYQSDTAARVYASGLEQTVLAWSMYDLARVAGTAYQKRRRVVAEAVNQLYRPDRAGWILAELRVWAKGTPLLQVHAVGAMLALTARVDAEAPDGRPDLLARLAEGSIGIEDLGHLWLVAFFEAGTATTAAMTLARWIRYGESAEEFRPYLIALLDAMVPKPAMRRRILFYLKRMPGFKDGLPDWMQERRRDS